jgi:hypothetical protein
MKELSIKFSLDNIPSKTYDNIYSVRDTLLQHNTYLKKRWGTKWEKTRLKLLVQTKDK